VSLRWFQRRFVDPLKSLLLAGITPARLAASLSAGSVIACFPLLGSTTALCALIAWAARLNMVAIQLANWIAYPLQIALLIPFYQLGGYLSDQRSEALPFATLIDQLREWPLAAVNEFGGATIRAIGAWSILSLTAFALLYLLIHAILNRMFTGFRKPDSVR